MQMDRSINRAREMHSGRMEEYIEKIKSYEEMENEDEEETPLSFNIEMEKESTRKNIEEGKEEGMRESEEESEKGYKEEGVDGMRGSFMDNESIRSWIEEGRIASAHSEPYIYVETESRLEYMGTLYNRAMAVLESPRFLYFLASFSLTLAFYIFRIILMRSFRIISHHGQQNFPYSLHMVHLLPIDGFLTIISLVGIFYFYRVRILHYITFILIPITHILYIISCIVVLGHLEKIPGFSRASYVFSATLSSLIVLFILNFCFRINRTNKSQILYLSALFFTSYLFILISQTKDLFEFAMDSNSINLMTIHDIGLKELKRKFGESNIGEREMQYIDRKYAKVATEITQKYLDKSTSLKISALVIMVVFYHLYKLILEIKATMIDDIVENERQYDDEINMIKNLGIFLFMQMMLTFGWSLVFNMSMMYMRYLVSEAFAPPISTGFNFFGIFG